MLKELSRGYAISYYRSSFDGQLLRGYQKRACCTRTQVKIMKKNTLFLSGRQEGKTTFGLYSLYRYIMDTDEKRAFLCRSVHGQFKNGAR